MKTDSSMNEINTLPHNLKKVRIKIQPKHVFHIFDIHLTLYQRFLNWSKFKAFAGDK